LITDWVKKANTAVGYHRQINVVCWGRNSILVFCLLIFISTVPFIFQKGISM
jgi:hypothetical protein